MLDSDTFIPQATADGSFTFFSKEFNESFHSHYGARQESFLKFVLPTRLAEQANRPLLRLLDVCYGLGYNTAAALQTIWAANPNCYVEVIGLELNAAVPLAAIAHNLFDKWNCESTQILTQLASDGEVQTDRLTAKLLIGDARNSIQLLRHSNFQAHAIFLDPFSPPQCPHLWTVEFIKQISLCLHDHGFLATYSCAAAVRTALLAADLQIGSTPPVGRRTPGTVAAHIKTGTEVGGLKREHACLCNSFILSETEKEHLLTRAAVPYRDPGLSAPANVILERRRQEQDVCSLEPTSRWRKRCLSKN